MRPYFPQLYIAPQHCDPYIQCRIALSEHSDTIISNRNALAVVEGVETYEPFIKTLNAVIAKYAVKHHHHRHNHADNSQNSQNNNTQNGGSI